MWLSTTNLGGSMLLQSSSSWALFATTPPRGYVSRSSMRNRVDAKVDSLCTGRSLPGLTINSLATGAELVETAP